ncbi:hypothetical protein UO65_2398 [Actinokineospora spheciospongiae]|uniref:Uncharacterized protein n=1 Tax=Actinokineospora spheciospongiae TaxID=909613 RepID=W7IPF3_9PSEU|nr:hypothetical protein UO65_2398 [Actinokineospora spheciospongiae]
MRVVRARARGRAGSGGEVEEGFHRADHGTRGHRRTAVGGRSYSVGARSTEWRTCATMFSC